MSTSEMFIDKSSWTVTKFGDVAIQQKVNVNREDTTLTKYVKGEHMSSEDIHLRSWGELQDEYLGPAFIRYFDEGDILYGSRRTYLKKVSIAPFEGITSNTTFVVKANEEKIDKRLLPFLMLSDGFTEHSIMHSKGSVNPYINWKDLANFEFLLPPKDQQAELAELLWTMDDVVQGLLKLHRKFKTLRIVEENFFFHNGQNLRLRDVIRRTLSGGTPNTKKAEYYSNGDIPWITTKILDSYRVRTGEKHISNQAISESAAKLLLKGNIVAGTRVGVGKFAINDVDISFSQDIIGLEVDEEVVDVEYLIHQLNSRYIQECIKPFVRGTTIKGITKEDLLSLKVFIPDIKKQNEIRDKFVDLKSCVKNVEFKILSSRSLQKSLINQIF